MIRSLYSYADLDAIRYFQPDLQVVSKAFKWGAIGYAGILLVNGAINGDDPIVQARSRSAIAVGMYAVWAGGFIFFQGRPLNWKSTGWSMSISQNNGLGT